MLESKRHQQETQKGEQSQSDSIDYDEVFEKKKSEIRRYYDKRFLEEASQQRINEEIQDRTPKSPDRDRCPNCGSKQLREDPTRPELQCRNCNTIIEKQKFRDNHSREARATTVADNPVFDEKKKPISTTTYNIKTTPVQTKT